MLKVYATIQVMNDIKQIVEDELCAVNKNLNNLFDTEEEIHRELQAFINSPQKRIRSLSALLYFKANGSINKPVGNLFINILTTGELIHNASLLHDDVIDGAKFRRGKATLGEVFSPQISILSGDLLLSLATEKLIEAGNWEIINYFWKCTKEMSEAEFKQYSLRGKKPLIDEYLKIAEGKTASLFEAIFKSCANITNFDIIRAENFAKNFGILFQLKNDLEIDSANADKKNKIFTPKDIFGIEKTKILIDNYLEYLRRDLEEIPQNIYREGLEDLLKAV